MPLASGTLIGPYEILTPLGSGGMGEVYRARDTKLSRDVALKLLPEAFAQDAERLARFEREAQVLASLNHPSIAHIYGLEESSGARALAMELVDGQTLADRLADGHARRLSLTEVLSIARQVADALETAHEKGIVHRDLKPANVMISSSGAVKVLDFGLAAIAQGPKTSGIDPTTSPTLTMAATQAGVIIGTAAYMSPEQAAGKTVDKRADVWSFGVLLWELLTARQLFAGETISHTLADVLRAPIDFAQLPAETPAVVRTLLRRCLDRDVRSRLRDIGEARVAIDAYLANPERDAQVASPRRTSARPWLTAVLAAVAVVALAGAVAVAFVHFREPHHPGQVVRFQIQAPEQTTFAYGPTLSPDGQRLAFEGPGPDGRMMIWVRSLDTLDTHALSGSEGVVDGIFWSPDSRSVGFAVNGFPDRLKRVEIAGGPAQTLCEFTGNWRGGAWNEQGVILFGATGTGLSRVAASGGTVVPVTKLDVAAQHSVSGAAFLPDGRHFVYFKATRKAESRGIYLGSLEASADQQNQARLAASDSNPVYVHTVEGGEGLLLFLREASLLAQPFDGSRLTGDPTVVAEDVGTVGAQAFMSVSRTGHLAFRAGRAQAITGDLLWFSRDGKRLGQVGPRGEYSGSGGLQLSPDGTRVLTARMEGATTSALGGVGRVWVAETARGIFSRLNTADWSESSPAISSDGRVVVSSTMNGAVGDLYWLPVTGVGSPEPLLVKSPTVKHPNDFSRDGRFLLFDDHVTPQQQDLYVLPMEKPAGGERKPIPFLTTPADETFGQFSPDGKWVAYTSNESGRREVFVQGFAPDRVPAAAVGKWQLSTAGGDKPRWSRDGKEVYYLSPDRKMMAVPVKIGSTFEPGLAAPLFDVPRLTGFFPYAVAPDGRFLLNTLVDTGTTAAAPVTVVLNWRPEPKR